MTSEEFQKEVRAKKNSGPEDELSSQLTAAGIMHERQFAFLPGRKFKADFHIRQAGLLVEIDGGIFQRSVLKIARSGKPYMTKSGHSSPVGIKIGMERLNEAALLGYYQMRFPNKL